MQEITKGHSLELECVPRMMSAGTKGRAKERNGNQIKITTIAQEICKITKKNPSKKRAE